MQIPENSVAVAPSAQRRRVLWGAVAGVAAVAGAGLSWRQQAASSVMEPVPGFWAQQWHPVLINFWATWCPPCVDELPLLDRFHTEQSPKGVQVLGLAIDRKEAVVPFLQRVPLQFPVALAGLSGTDLGRALGNVTGGLPFSVLVASDGAVAQRKMGRVHAEDLVAWAAVK